MAATNVAGTSREDNSVGRWCNSGEQTADLLVPSSYFQWKDIIDWGLAAILLIPGLPIIGLMVLLVRLTSQGPGIYRQIRVGKDGRAFTMYKIRTMRHDAEAGSGPVWPKTRDPRVTGVGRVLRKLHLDEFPQLFNVLKGEMSLIGPRPERPEFVRVLAREIPGYLKRLSVRPGITGLAQINFGPDTDLASVQRKLVLDTEYIRRGGLFLDIRMLVYTFIHLLGLNGAFAKRIMKLHRQVTGLNECTSPAEELSGLFATPADVGGPETSGPGRRVAA